MGQKSFTKLADKVAEERADEREMQPTARNVATLMESMKITLEQAMKGEDSSIVMSETGYFTQGYASCVKYLVF